MFKTAFAASLAAVAFANEPHFIEAVSNDECDLTIQQLSGNENFTAVDSMTYPEPTRVKKGSTQKFNIGGYWAIDGSILDNVTFTCLLNGAEVFNEEYKCTDAAENDYGNCVKPAPTPGAQWSADFGFDVPAIAPQMFVYDAHVTGYKADGTKLFEMESKFKIC